MMKFLFMLLIMYIFMKVNKLVCFMYNYIFFFSLLLMMSKMWNFDLSFLMSMGLSLDMYSFNLVLLSTWIIGLMYMCSKKKIENYLFLIMMMILFFFFSLKNLLLFYLMFEISLIPMFFIVTYLGYNLERLNAAYYMLMYTLLISLPLLIMIMKLFVMCGSMDFDIMGLNINYLGFWELLVIYGAFFVKVPMYMFHIWLPKAHVEAPVYGSMILASILLKLGSYGLLRMLMIFLDSGMVFSNIYISIGLVGSMVVSLLCLVQVDMKSLVAYSSVVHMNMMICGLMSFMKIGYFSAYIIMVSHGLCSSGLFYMVNLFYSRSSSRLLMFNKGLSNLMSLFMIMWFLLCILNFSFPLSIAFIGEILLVGVLIKWEIFIMIYMIIVGMLSSAYSLYLFLYVFHGEVNMNNKFNSGSVKEMLVVMFHIIPLMFLLMNMNLF